MAIQPQCRLSVRQSSDKQWYVVCQHRNRKVLWHTERYKRKTHAIHQARLMYGRMILTELELPDGTVQPAVETRSVDARLLGPIRSAVVEPEEPDNPSSEPDDANTSHCGGDRDPTF